MTMDYLQIDEQGNTRVTATPRVAFTILGQPCSKANSRRLVRFGKRAASIKSKDALAYERTAALQIPPEARVMFEGPVRVTMTLFYRTERPDLDASIVLDVLQAKCARFNGKRVVVEKGVYLNDRQVRELHLYHGIDKANPRAEIEVEAMT